MKRMDEGHLDTERILKEVESDVTRVYRQAAEETEKKLDDYLRRFKIKDQIKRDQLQKGEITKDEYNYWRTGQIMIGKRWEEMKNTLAQDLHNANNIARSITQGYMPKVYAVNHNYATFQVEKESLVDTSYILYDRQTVERIIKDQPDLLPSPGPRKLAEIAAGKDIKWQRGQIQSTMMQVILQGESIPHIAKRMAKELSVKNRSSAVRYARTAATGAQNAGRVDGYKRAQGMGIELEQEWLATLDMRTRHEHRYLDGQHVPVGEPFKVDGYEIRFPGDPSAPGYLIWNCRCTLVPHLKNLDQSDAPRKSKLGDMSYEEWKNEHKKEAITESKFGYEYGANMDFPKFMDGGGVEWHSFTVSRETGYGFPDGSWDGIHARRDADVFTLDDGTKVIFPSDMDDTKQTIRPDDVFRQYYELPEYYRKEIQKTIVVCDYQNPQDSYWAKEYNMPGFKSYMIGGKEITVWEYTRQHDMDYFTKALVHEGGHYIDHFTANNISRSKEWADAVTDDLKATGFDAPSDYARDTARNNPGYFVEDFADSCAEFVTNRDFFVANFPNRAGIIKRLLKIKG